MVNGVLSGRQPFTEDHVHFYIEHLFFSVESGNKRYKSLAQSLSSAVLTTISINNPLMWSSEIEVKMRLKFFNQNDSHGSNVEL